MALTRGVKHHGCRKGKWVALSLKSGATVVDRFDQSDDHRVRLASGDEFMWRNVRRFRVLRSDERPNTEAR